MKKLLSVLLGVLMVLSLAAFAEEEAPTVAYLSASTTTPFWTWVEDGITDACEERGWELQVYNSDEDAATQLKNAQNAIISEVDAIIVSPVDSASCPAVLDEAEAAGIPVVICDVGTEEGTYLSYISTPNYEGSYEVGEYLAKYLTDNGLSGSIAMIDVPLSRINGQLRYEGFEAALAEYGFSVAQVLESDTFTLDEADSQARNLITAHDDLVAIYAAHSQATLGVVAAVQDLGLGDQIVVCSFDGDPDTADYLQTGKVLVCGAQQAKKMGREALYALDSNLNGEVPAETIEVPAFLLTADNVADYQDVIENDICGLN